MSRPVRRVGNAPRGWLATLRTRPLLDLLGRWSAPVACVGPALAIGGCADLSAAMHPDDTANTALDDQRQDGWNVGGEDRPLEFAGAQTLDVAGGVRWREVMPTLALHLAPAGTRWAPYYNPTLFQALETPRNAALAAVIRPIFTPQMATASARGAALLSLLADGGVCRSDVAVVLDLPGPEAIAVAAALAPCLDPVFTFANWPHPLGVVPAHLTLGAALYELPAFEQQRTQRPSAAAPVFVLDRSRLAPYVDDAGAFDNRYFANLPGPEIFQAAGITHVLYVTPDDGNGRESDDLNDDLVGLDRQGIDVQLLALTDFSETPLPGWPDFGPPQSPAPVANGVPAGGPRFYFGGSAGSHACFWNWYGWSHRSPAHPVGPPPPSLGARCHIHPAPRGPFVSAPGHGWGGSGSGHGLGALFGHAGFGRSGSLGRASTGMSG